MSKGNTWRVTAGVTTAFLLSSTLAVFPAPGAAPVVHAAEQKREVSRESAIQLVQQRIGIPEGYKLENAQYEDQAVDAPIWNLVWSKGRDQMIFISLNASTGKIQQFSRYEQTVEAPAGTLDLEEARRTAIRYLETLTSPEERAKLSEANEYAEIPPYYPGNPERSFTFTRVENGLPFLENGFRISLNSRGELEFFSRQWYEGELPAPARTISLEEAEQKLADGMAPSLLYSRRSSLGGLDNGGSGKQTLVYQYNPLDPQFVDAVSGEVINAHGKPAKPQKIEPLGTSTADPDREQPLITREQAQQIADQLIQKFPGTYRSEGQRGSGVSSGPDGIERRSWSFAYTPVEPSRDSGKPLELTIGDRGELVGYQHQDWFGERGERSVSRLETNTGEPAVFWEQAEKRAIELVKRLYADRLGEIYLIGNRPTEEQIRETLERGGAFEIRFGWLHDGIPIEHAEFYVIVDPESGEVVELRIFQNDLPSPQGETGEFVDLNAAKQAEIAEKTLMLTYYQPAPSDYRAASETPAPILVYRYVGDHGHVDAHTGEWVSYKELRNRQTPQDIDGHPQQAALQLTLDRGLFSVTDGKLEPERLVTRGEMARIIARMSDWSEFHQHVFFGDGDEATFTFVDVDQTHPLFGVIQKNLRNGYIAREGQNFEPERPITRAEAAEMLARLLGYEELLDNPELFVPVFSDLQKEQVPAVSILHVEGIFPGKSTERFEPDSALTRAEVAQLVQALIEYKEKANES